MVASFDIIAEAAVLASVSLTTSILRSSQPHTGMRLKPLGASNQSAPSNALRRLRISFGAHFGEPDRERASVDLNSR